MTDTPRIESQDPVKCGCDEYPECTHVLYFYQGAKHAGAAMRARAADTPVLEPLRELIKKWPTAEWCWEQRSHVSKGPGDCAIDLESLLPAIEARIADLYITRREHNGLIALNERLHREEVAAKDAELSQVKSVRDEFIAKETTSIRQYLDLKVECATVIGKLLDKLERLNWWTEPKPKEYQAARELKERIEGAPKEAPRTPKVLGICLTEHTPHEFHGLCEGWHIITSGTPTSGETK